MDRNMDKDEEKKNLKFWQMRGTLTMFTGLIVLLSSLYFYFLFEPGNYFMEIAEEIVVIGPTLILSSYLVFLLDLKYKKCKSGYLRYLRNSLLYLYVIIPFWIISAAIALSFGKPLLTLFYLEVIMALIIALSLVNVRVQIWKRRSKAINNEGITERARLIANKMGIKISGLRVIDWSKEKIANAFQAGLTHYYIFVSNFLLDNLSVDEDVAIIAHELAHAKKKHLKKTLLFLSIDIIILGNIFFVVTVFLLNLGVRLGMAVGIFASMFITLYLLLPVLQRRFEREADIFAVNFIEPRFLADSLLKISKLNHAPVNTPRRWNLSHPATSDRISYLEKLDGYNNEADPLAIN